MKPCRECKSEVSEQAMACPQCGAPYPARAEFTGWGFEYRSEATLAGLPWLHISFKYTARKVPVPARGVVAIGQFAVGIFTISQFGVGVFSLGQFALAGWALAQFAVAYSLIAQMGLYFHEGRGQLVASFWDVMAKF